MEVNGYEIKPFADLQGANLQRADLQGADLRYANLQGANLPETDLQGADLQYANLHEADLPEANLQRANLQGANLQGANLQGANLQGANLTGANLPETDFVMQCPWSIAHIQRDNIRIGCEYHTTKEWKKFTDEEINQMDPIALARWTQWKPVVMAAARACKPYPKK